MGHIDPSTGRNKRDKGPNRQRDGEAVDSPERQNGKIVDRAESARALSIGRALRRRSR